MMNDETGNWMDYRCRFQSIRRFGLFFCRLSSLRASRHVHSLCKRVSESEVVEADGAQMPWHCIGRDPVFGMPTRTVVVETGDWVTVRVQLWRATFSLARRPLPGLSRGSGRDPELPGGMVVHTWFGFPRFTNEQPYDR